jgi:L-iditol 2-dehydrogenase
MLQETGVVEIVDVEVPQVGPRDVLICVHYAGVCGSDLHSFAGRHPFRHAPVVLGHEVSGTVVRVGDEVTECAPGDRVTVMPYESCGQCIYCRRGLSNICTEKRVPGIKGWTGTFADYFCAPAQTVFELGENTSLELGALAEPLAVAIHAVDRGQVDGSGPVLVLGGGSIGLLTALSARAAGAEQVVLTDLYEHNLRVARELGFDARQADEADLSAALQRDYAGGFHAVLLASSAPPTVALALDQVQRRGRIVVIGLFVEAVTVRLVDFAIYETEMVGSTIYTACDFERAIERLDRDGISYAPLITRVAPLEETQDVLAALHERREDAIKVLLSVATS